MNKEQLQTLLQNEFPDVEFNLQGDGCHFQVQAIGEIFAGLSRIKRQQLLNKVLAPLITQGDVHAVNYTLLTPSEAEENKGG